MQCFAHNEALDESLLSGASSEAIGFRLASESFKPIRRLERQELETLR